MSHLNRKPTTKWATLRHGGNLNDAIKLHGGKHEEWIDLSSGISPWNYPLPNIQQDHWHHLPPPIDQLLEIATQYYDCNFDSIIATPGTQLVIRLLPRLFCNKQNNGRKTNIAIPVIGYQEHHQSWICANHSISTYKNIQELNELVEKRLVNHVIVINPNNPTGDLLDTNMLNAIARKLSGVLIVDEAFMDVDNTESLCRNDILDNIIILRSLGKFFGLAGARVGFLISNNSIKDELEHLLSPWILNTSAQKIAESALSDIQWQTTQRERIKKNSIELHQLLSSTLDNTLAIKNVGLFNTVIGNSSMINIIHKQLAKHRIWTRIGDEKNHINWLRLSLPTSHTTKLKSALLSV